MKLQGISNEGLKRIASKVKGQSELTEPTKQASRKRAQEDTGQDYLKTVESVAQGIKEDYKNYGNTDIEQMIHEAVDGNHYIIYYHANLIVLQNSDNSDAIDDAGIDIDTSKGWQQILTQVAYFAMEADVRDALQELGYDGEGFGDEDEEDIEEEF